MGDIAEFLQARIAEDEADAAYRHREDCEHLDSVRPFPCECGVPQWVLAECAAKRAIVGDHIEEETRYCPTCVEQEIPCNTLLRLAAVYAGHPDYRQGWQLVPLIEILNQPTADLAQYRAANTEFR